MRNKETFFVPFDKDGGTIIDYEDMPIAMCFSWHKHSDGYAYAGIPDGKSTSKHVLLHRLLMNFPEKFIDHKDKNKLNNSKFNLRHVTHRENHNNRSDHGMWPVGVSYNKFGKNFLGRIYINGKTFNIGRSIDPISLGIIYEEIKKELME